MVLVSYQLTLHEYIVDMIKDYKEKETYYNPRREVWKRKED